jgi:hypothetical protein
MEKNKRRLTAGLFGAALGAAFIFMAAGYIREIRGGREAIARCRKALEDARPLPPGYLFRLESQLTELRARETTEGTAQSAARRNPEDPAGMIRNALRSHAIGVERLRTLSAGGGAAMEFVLSAAPVNFLKFLRGAADLPLPLNYVSIKPKAILPLSILR